MSVVAAPARLTCQEQRSIGLGSLTTECGLEATRLVWHDRERRVYPMCEGCADHNVRNRGGWYVTTQRGRGQTSTYCGPDVPVLVLESSR